MTIIPTMPGDKTFQLFERFPEKIYSSNYHRQKLSETLNPDYLKSCYLLLYEGEVKARAALYHNPELKYLEKKAWTIGNYEAVEDLKYGSQLIQYLVSVAKAQGADYVIGPMNGSTWDNYRFALDHIQPEFFTESFHHLTYNQHYLNAGFEVIARYYSNIAGPSLPIDPEIEKRDQELTAEGVTIRSINLEKYVQEMERIFDFNIFAFSNNFLYTPISKDSFIKKYGAVKSLLNPEHTTIAEDANGNLIGYYFCIDDQLNSSEKSLIFKTLVRHPNAKWRGLGHVMGNRIYQKAISQGYKSFIHSFIYEKGTSVDLSKNFSGKRYKNYVLYGKAT